VLTHLVFIEAYHYLWRAEAFVRRSQNKEALEMLEASLACEMIPRAKKLQYRLKLEVN